MGTLLRNLLNEWGKIDRLLKNRWFRIGILASIVGVVAAGGLILVANLEVGANSSRVYERLEEVPALEFALLPGTARIVQGKYLNPYFQHRIDAAVALYRAGKIRKIIVSGDNSRRDYNEPEDMRRALRQCGIPDADILSDFAGFRTLDSVVRARNLFQAQEWIVVSQRFHCERAIFLARAHGMDRVIGFAAEDVPPRFRVKRFFREPLACVKAWLDVRVLHTRPRFER